MHSNLGNGFKFKGVKEYNTQMWTVKIKYRNRHLETIFPVSLGAMIASKKFGLLKGLTMGSYLWKP